MTMPKNVLVTAAKLRRGRRRGNLFGRYANTVPYANMLDGLSCLKVIIHANLMGITDVFYILSLFVSSCLRLLP